MVIILSINDIILVYQDKYISPNTRMKHANLVGRLLADL